MLKHSDNSVRFVNNKDGKGTIDTEMEPAVLKAQIAYAKTKEGGRAELRAQKLEEQRKIHEYLTKDEED